MLSAAAGAGACSVRHADLHEVLAHDELAGEALVSPTEYACPTTSHIADPPLPELRADGLDPGVNDRFGGVLA
jgi:hypothetical protein